MVENMFILVLVEFSTLIILKISSLLTIFTVNLVVILLNIEQARCSVPFQIITQDTLT